MNDEASTLQDTEPEQASEHDAPLLIEPGIPIPMRPSRFKWGADMEIMRVGDSVFFPNKKDGEYFAGLLNRFGHGYLTEPENKGLRVWKVRKKAVRKKKVVDEKD